MRPGQQRPRRACSCPSRAYSEYVHASGAGPTNRGAVGDRRAATLRACSRSGQCKPQDVGSPFRRIPVAIERAGGRIEGCDVVTRHAVDPSEGAADVEPHRTPATKRHSETSSERSRSCATPVTVDSRRLRYCAPATASSSRVALAITRDDDVAAEAVQEVFMRAMRGRRRFRAAGSLEAWVWCRSSTRPRAWRRGRGAGWVFGPRRREMAPATKRQRCAA
jgi:Sigma-70 region 2